MPDRHLLILRDVLVPRVLVSDPRSFGGRLDGSCLRGDLHADGARVRLHISAASDAPRLVIPALVEPHCHLDKCHSIARMVDVGGDLSQALARQRQDKLNWTEADLIARATRGLNEAAAAGCFALRTHVDWGDPAAPPLAWSVLNGLKQDSPLNVHCAALTSVEHMADPAYCDAVAGHVAQANGALGAFIHGQPDIAPAIANMFDAATRFGLPLDFHVDETLEPLSGLEAIADAAIACGFEGPVLCGHAVALINDEGDALARLLGKLRRARITVCALPTTNLYLQGRVAGTPERRGLTRLRELRAAGVPVIVGSDNVGDAFCPLGQHDPMAALSLTVLAAHLDPPFEQWLSMVTTDAAAAIGIPPPFVDQTSVENLKVSAAQTLPDLLAGRAPLSALLRPF